MKLLEYKGKELLQRFGIKVPAGIVVNNHSYINLSHHKERYREFFYDSKKVIIKAQVISGKRKKQGLVATSDNYEESLKIIDEFYQKEFNGVPIDTLLIERLLEIDAEYFLSITYDTKTRKPMVLISKNGGTDIEEQHEVHTYHPLSATMLRDFEARLIAQKAETTGGNMIQLAAVISKAYKCFMEYDCIALEINPIIKTKDGMLYAGDAKITIDDSAIARHELFADIVDTEDKTFLSERELEARRIDYKDHRGVAGKTFVDLDGDIAVLASGGGASLTAMDALIEAGGKPANYTEYSGNPPKEKVKKLTEITLSKNGLRGCLVIGGTANFTDIYETLTGFAEGLLSVQPRPHYPIVVRRAGPRDVEAFAYLKEFATKHGFDITLFDEKTPMSLAAKIMAEKAAAFKENK